MTRSNDDFELSQSEWRAVSIGLQDAAKCDCGVRSGFEGYGLRRLAKMLTGRNEPEPLSSPRLDALRSFVCAT